MRALLLALAILLAPLPASAQSSTQALTCGTLITLQNSGVFIPNGSNNLAGSGCANNNRVFVRSDFVFWFQSSGCVGASNQVLTYGQMLACRVLYTLQTWSVVATATSGSTTAFSPNSPTTVSVDTSQFPIGINASAAAGDVGNCLLVIQSGGQFLDNGGAIVPGGSISVLFPGSGGPAITPGSVINGWVSSDTPSGGVCSVSVSVTYYH